MSGIDHYLNAIKRSILQGTSRTSVDMSVRDEETLLRLKEDVVPTETLKKLGKKSLAEVNGRFDQFKEWVGAAIKEIRGYSPAGVEDTDKEIMIADLEELFQQVKAGGVKAEAYRLLMSYLQQGVPDKVREGSTADVIDYMLQSGGVGKDLLIEACQYDVRCQNVLGEISDVGESVTPFPITYLVYADITEVDLIGNAERVPARANNLRDKISRNFERELTNGSMSLRDQMSLYRILGPERAVPKAAVEINHTEQNTQQQLIIVKDASKLKPQNLVVNDNAELLGVGAAYGNMDKSGLLRLAAGETATSTKEAITIAMK